MSSSVIPAAHRVMRELPAHLAEWQLPPGWRWGAEGLSAEYRHFQELIDALGRSLALVSAPDPSHASWLESEARNLAHRNHPSAPTTYHYWTATRESRRGPGYLRRWIAGETVAARIARLGTDDIPQVLRTLRATGSALAYLHDAGAVHGAISSEWVWVTPTGRLWLLGWQWALPRADIPSGLMPDPRWTPRAPEWGDRKWSPTVASDQWQLAALCFYALTGERPPASGAPPIQLIRPDVPTGVAAAVDRALLPDPNYRHASVAAFLRAVDRVIPSRTAVAVGVDEITESAADPPESEEARLRWATGDDYEVLSKLGSGSFGSVWRVRDLTLEREVALKMLHPHVARDNAAVARFRREARLAAQLAHPAIVPIYDWDSRGELSWYTMELAEGGSVADLVARSGARPLGEVAPQVDQVLDGLAAAHAAGVIHRDLKPENILIDRYRRWRVGDFGIANVTGEDRAGQTGTPAFAAPEQLLGEAQGPAADCFAMAAIVFFVITGFPPFAGTEEQTILANQLARRFDVGTIAPEVGAWLRRGLEPQPDDRFPDAIAMQDAWRRAIREAMSGTSQRRWWNFFSRPATSVRISTPIPMPRRSR